jgi:hypothetical protein
MPHLLGFHPASSLVAVAFAGARVVFLARIDLHEPGTPPGEIGTDLAALGKILMRQTPDMVLLIGYGNPEQVTPVIGIAEAVLAGYRVPVGAALRVTGSRYFHCHCTSPECCPPDGTPFDPATSTVAAQAVYAGHVALPDRAARVASLASVTGPAREAMHAATGRAWDRLERVADAAASALTGSAEPVPECAALNPSTPELASAFGELARGAGEEAVRRTFGQHQDSQPLTDDDVAWLTLLLQDPVVRDGAWAHTRDAGEHTQIRFWSGVTRRAEPGLVPAPACLLALAALHRGDGILAQIALDQALDADPGYTLALLLSEVIRQGIPPAVLDALLDGTTDPAPGQPAGH